MDLGTTESNRNATNQDVTMVYVRLFIEYFGRFFLIVVISFGVCGNILSITIFYRRRKKDRVSAQYLAPLAFVDLCAICFTALPTWLFNNLEPISNGKFKNDRMFGVTSHLGCQFFTYLWLTVSFISSWILVVFSLERVLVIWMPLKMAPIVSSSKPRRIALACVFVSPCLIFLNQFRFSGMMALDPTRPDRISCAWHPDISAQEKTAHVMMFNVFVYGAPICFIIILNILILVGIRRARSESKGTKSTTSTDKSSKADGRQIRSLMLICMFYVLFSTPLLITWSIFLDVDIKQYEGWSLEAIDNLGQISYFTSSLIGLNYACNSLVYVLSLNHYRKECWLLLTCRTEEEGGK